MKLHTLRRNAGIATAAVALSISLAACSSDEEPTTSGDTTSEAPSEEAPEEAPEEAGDDAEAQTFGDACGEVPADGAGSFNGMVQDPVATAASNNPLLSTLVAAVGAAGLGDTLNTAEGLTVFAPYNPAFEAIPEEDLNALLEDPETLGNILTNHVIAGQLDPEAVVGEQEALNGGTLTVEGDTDGMTVNGATVLCGNVPTANATVYIIDTVLEANN